MYLSIFTKDFERFHLGHNKQNKKKVKSEMKNCAHELTCLHTRKPYTIAVNDHHNSDNCPSDFRYIKTIYRLGFH